MVIPVAVRRAAGNTTTPKQMKEIFDGVAQPAYSVTAPLAIEAAVVPTTDNPVNQVEVVLKIVSD